MRKSCTGDRDKITCVDWRCSVITVKPNFDFRQRQNQILLNLRRPLEQILCAQSVHEECFCHEGFLIGMETPHGPKREELRDQMARYDVSLAE